MKTKTRDKTKEKELKRKEGGETWKRFGFRRRNFRLSKKKWDDRDTVGVSSLSLSRNDTTASQSVWHSHCHRLPLTSLLCSWTNEWTKKKTKETNEKNKRTDSRSSFPRNSGGGRSTLHSTHKCVVRTKWGKSRRRRNELRWNRISSRWRHSRIQKAWGLGVF